MLRLFFLALVGWLIPLRYSGRRYFRIALQNCGVNISGIPSACLDELADQAIKTGRNIARLAGHHLQTHVVQQLDGEAAAIALILDPPAREINRIDQAYRKRFAPILERHGVRLPVR